jgi:hypothetical protein
VVGITPIVTRSDDHLTELSFTPGFGNEVAAEDRNAGTS